MITEEQDKKFKNLLNEVEKECYKVKTIFNVYSNKKVIYTSNSFNKCFALTQYIRTWVRPTLEDLIIKSVKVKKYEPSNNN